MKEGTRFLFPLLAFSLYRLSNYFTKVMEPLSHSMIVLHLRWRSYERLKETNRFSILCVPFRLDVNSVNNSISWRKETNYL